MIVTCPTGFTVEVRKLKTKEINFLIDRKKFKETFADRLLQDCVLNVQNMGVYAFDPGKPVDWGRVAVADRTAALVKIRIATYGDEYDFDLNCQMFECKKRIRWTVKLSDMPYTSISQETLELFKAGNRAEHQLGSATVSYKVILTGKDANEGEALLEKMQDRQLTAALSTRIIDISGVPAAKRIDWLDDLDADELEGLKDVLSKADGGYDNELLVKCPHCEAEQPVMVPFDRSFFLPRQGKRS